MPSRATRKSASKRAVSEELGDGDLSLSYNPRTGRPVRRSAGRKSTNSDFIDPVQAISDAEDHDTDEEKYVRPRKRRRSPSPPVSPRMEIDEPYSPVRSPERSLTEEAATPVSDVSPISLTFNVPPGHSGPFVINLDVAALMGMTIQPNRNAKHKKTSLRLSTDSDLSSRLSRKSERPQSPVQERAGFLSLPPELRNEIYRLAFVLPRKERFDLGKPSNFARSSALLRTCRQVHEEGRTILYSENTFLFQRNTSARTQRWTTDVREVGFKDLRFFLKSIGPTNISFLRHIIFLLEDAVPSLNPHLTSAEERRFVHDDYLMASLKLLGLYGALSHLDLAFYGRKTVSKTDVRFLDYLRGVKADKIHFIHHPLMFTSPCTKIDLSLRQALPKEMERSTPLHGFGTKKKHQDW